MRDAAGRPRARDDDRRAAARRSAFVATIIPRHASEFCVTRRTRRARAPLRHRRLARPPLRRHRRPRDPGDSLNGSREGLFTAALALSPEAKAGARPAVLVPNPFYQAYGAGALAAGAELVPVPATAATGFLPDYGALPAALLDRVTLAYICSPANPQGAVADAGYLARLIALADVTISASSPRMLQRNLRASSAAERPRMAAAASADPERSSPSVALQALERPGLRCGLRRRRPAVIAALRQLRAYGGAPLPLPLQRAAPRSGSDEAHVTPAATSTGEVRAGRPAARGIPGYPPPRGRLLPLAPGRRLRGRGVAALARDRRPRSPGRLPRPTTPRRRTPAATTSGWRWSRRGRGGTRPRRRPQHARTIDFPGEGRIDGGTHQDKPRAPLMESDTEAALRRRGTELVGLILAELLRGMTAEAWNARGVVNALSAPLSRLRSAAIRSGRSICSYRGRSCSTRRRSSASARTCC